MKTFLVALIFMALSGCNSGRYTFQSYDDGDLYVYTGSIQVKRGVTLSTLGVGGAGNAVDLIPGKYDCMECYQKGYGSHMDRFKEWTVIHEPHKIKGIRWEKVENEVYDDCGLVLLWNANNDEAITDDLYNGTSEAYEYIATYCPLEQGGVQVNRWQINTDNSNIIILPSSGSIDDLYAGYDGPDCVAIKMVLSLIHI